MAQLHYSKRPVDRFLGFGHTGRPSAQHKIAALTSKCRSNNCRYACSLSFCSVCVANVSESGSISRLLVSQRIIVAYVSVTISRPGHKIRRKYRKNL
ncbi:MAG: hypothetical protein GY774_28935 [Planctomycetes bacterium]|nr:hypothetical protein [Planctomycetota bacterium]